MNKTKEPSTIITEPDFSALPEELSMLLQIDLLMGRKKDFNRRLTHALNDLAVIAQGADASIKH